MRRVAAYVPDLLDRSKVAGVPGVEVTFVDDPGKLAAAEADLVIIDLGRDGAIEAIAGLAGRRVVGFGSHVDTERLEAARAAGCTEVLPRSRFFARLSEVLGD